MSRFETGLGSRNRLADEVYMASDSKPDSKSNLKSNIKKALSPGAQLAQEAISELKKRRDQSMVNRGSETEPGPEHLAKIRSASTAPVSGTAAARRTPRRPFQRPVGVLVGGHYEVLRARQLSEGGISIFLGEFGSRLRIKVEEVKVGQKLCVTFLLPSGDNLSLAGEVIYHDAESGPGLNIGIKFGTVPLHQRRLIRAYVSSKKAGESVAGQLAA